MFAGASIGVLKAVLTVGSVAGLAVLSGLSLGAAGVRGRAESVFAVSAIGLLTWPVAYTLHLGEVNLILAARGAVLRFAFDPVAGPPAPTGVVAGQRSIRAVGAGRACGGRSGPGQGTFGGWARGSHPRSRFAVSEVTCGAAAGPRFSIVCIYPPYSGGRCTR